MRRSFLLILLGFCSNLPLQAQGEEACQRSIRELRTSVLTQPEELFPGAIVYLSERYVRRLTTGVYDSELSSLRHYEYLRPGTREEIRGGLAAEAAETGMLGPDGNVYREVVTAAGWHFFKPKRGFHGDYQPRWEDPLLHVPPGLDPVDVREAGGKALRVLEFQPAFLRLRSGDEEWVFFTGYPDLTLVFDTESVRSALVSKQVQAEALVGKRLMARLGEDHRFLPTLDEKVLQFGPEIGSLEFPVSEVVVEHERVLIGFGDPRIFLIVDAESDAVFFDLDCLRGQVLNRYLADEGAIALSNERLNRLMHEQVPVSEWSRDPGLVAALEQRFRLGQHDLAAHRWYEHALLMQAGQHMQSYVTACLREDGFCFVQSHYSSGRGLYHTRIQVEAGREPLESSRIPTLDPRSTRRRIEGYTVETISFDDPIDQPLLVALAAQPDQPIGIRFVAGGSFYEEVELHPQYRQIIRDVYLMSELLRFRAQDR